MLLPLAVDPDRPILGRVARHGAPGPPETPLQPSPEQDAIVAARRADPTGSLRVVAFAGAGKTTTLRLLAEADPTPALYIAYNWRLYSGEPVPDVPSLARFRGWDELVEEAGEAHDPEPRFLVQLVVHYGRALPGLVANLRRRAAPHSAAAERVLSTAHKAKGLEWPRVRLADDFPGLEELDALDRDGLPWLTAEERDQELHLLYVAATRARQGLEPNAAVRSCLAARAV